ncbi:MAG: L-aspartate oxidase [Candidatus Thorarchaeota archaeon]|nr:MAG: L-aspartate oxidase [Candidatus Thorarchaeota archaeon]RLI56890.1 MAG: L-aspartate oxidase [Candidatus Thorarchaeota archaeon]
MFNKIYTSDFLVIGSGLAGLLFALKASKNGKVHIVTKETLSDSATERAQGGIAAVVSIEDSIDLHIEDTIRVGDGLCHRDVVEEIVQEGPARVRELIELGVDFCKDENSGKYELGLEGGHSKRRVLHVKDHTGADIEKALVERVRHADNIEIFENHMAVNLYVANNQVHGAYVLDKNTSEVERFSSRIVVLATGGAGRVFLYTSNPDVATGDGIAMAYRAGATVQNLEMVQVHPTLLYHHKVRSFLISEALRGEGALLLGPDGQRFMPKYHEKAELGPRDEVARAIDNELKRTGADHVWLDISFKDPEFIRERFPVIYETCLSAGIDITKEPIPVVPAAHYMMGGVRADTSGRTDVKGLYAIGETACTGFHGANRLASNSLLEAAVLAHNASIAANEEIKFHKSIEEMTPWDPGEATDADELVVLSHLWDEVRRIMINYVGIVRSNKRLIRARNRIGFISREINQFYWDYKITPDLVELRNIVTVAELIIKMARMRKESRGAHFNKDYPLPSKQAVDTILRKGYIPVEQ